MSNKETATYWRMNSKDLATYWDASDESGSIEDQRRECEKAADDEGLRNVAEGCAVTYWRGNQETIYSEDDRREVADFAKSKGVHIVAEFSDRGFSGLTEWHSLPKLLELLALARKGRFKTVIVKDMTRLSRSPETCYRVVALLKDMGVRFLSVREGFDSNVANGYIEALLMFRPAGQLS